MTNDRNRRMPDDGRASDPTTDRAMDALVRRVAREVLRDPEAAAWQDERFVRWLAEEERAADRVEARRSDGERLDRGRALMRRVQARRLGVALREERVPTAERVTRPSAGHARRAPCFDLGVAAGAGRELWDQPPEAWVELPRELPEGEYVALRVAGTSMTPVLHDGDTILVQRGAALRPESVIVARHPDDGYVCKKVQRIGRTRVELASLEPGRPLITIPHDPALILGTVLLVWCTHREARPRPGT